MIHAVWVATPENYCHSSCFNEAAEAMRDALEELQGIKVELVTDGYIYCQKKTLVFGAHLIPESDIGNVIIYNSEEVSDKGGWIKPEYIQHMRQHEVWDFSPFNVQRLKEKYGIEAKYVPLGYMPCLTKIPGHVQNIDVLFYGCNNPRRDKVLTELQKYCNLVYLSPGIYGKQRDSYIARAKIVLNMHFYEPKIFEMFRCSYLLANKKCIVSEYGADRELEKNYNWNLSKDKGGIFFTDYDKLAETCVGLLKDKFTEQRQLMGKINFEIFSKQSQVEILKAVVA